MKKFFDNIVAPVAVAAIVGTAGILWSFNARLTRIESKLEALAPASHASALDRSHQLVITP